MAKHIWSLVCRESKIEQDTNNVSIIDAYESLQFDLQTDGKESPKDAPIGIPFNFEIISLFFRDNMGSEESIEKIVTVLDPGGKELGEFKFEGQFKPDQNRLRIRMKFNSIALTISGTYLFQIYTRGVDRNKLKRVATIPVDIKVSVDNIER